MQPKVIIHGGFFSESSEHEDVKTAKQQALKEIVTEAYSFLKSATAIETVAFAVSLLEDCDLFNAGLGSQVQSDGKVRMSASIMEGVSKKFSGVINIEDVKNPVYIAQKLLSEEDRVLSGIEALRYARKNGFLYYNPVIESRWHSYVQKLQEPLRKGTVGCVALDSEGRLAAATSTGGKGFEIPGRVSDSATVAGNFAGRHAAVSCTGVGEDIVSAALAAQIVTRVTDGLPLADAVKKTFLELKEFDGFAGVIGITAKGEVCHFDSHPYMVWASYEDDLQCFS